MAAVEQRGADYGLQIHWGKVHLVPVFSARSIWRGASSARVDALPGVDNTCQWQVWQRSCTKNWICEVSLQSSGHSAEKTALRMTRKIQLLDAVILSKLLYGVASAWLLKADLRRLDGFHANCLRQMLRIRCAYMYVSRISNDRVRKVAGVEAFSRSVGAMRLKLMRQVLRDPHRPVLRDAAFHKGSTRPLTNMFVRRVGRPRQNWTDEVAKIMQR